MIARIKAAIARRRVRQIARRALADDVAIRRVMVGIPFEKRRAAQLKGRRQAT